MALGIAPPVLSADNIREWCADLATMPPPTDDPARVDLLRAAEELKAAVAALQARVTVEFANSQLAEQEAAGIPSASGGWASPRRSLWLGGRVRLEALGASGWRGRWSASCPTPSRR